MKNIIGILCILSLCACTTIATQNTQVTLVQACGAYGVAFQTALQLRIAGKLSESQIDQITKIDDYVTPICISALPMDSAALTQEVITQTAALTLESK